MADEERSGSCVVCWQVDPREGLVCDRDRQRYAAMLWELRDLHALLPHALEPVVAGRTLASSYREAPLPLRAVALDLAGRPPRSAAEDAVQDYRGDQDGPLPVAAVLDSWARDWASCRDDEELPAPTVDELVAWLSRRLPWAFDHHPAVDDFAVELTTTLYRVRTVLAVSRRPEYSPLPCPGCGVTGLRRQSGDAVWRCGNCREEVPLELGENVTPDS